MAEGDVLLNQLVDHRSRQALHYELGILPAVVVAAPRPDMATSLLDAGSQSGSELVATT